MSDKRRKGISIGSLLFWSIMGWIWFGDNIKVYINSNVKVKKNVDDIKNVINDEIKPEFKQLIDEAKKEFTKQKEEIIAKKEDKRQNEPTQKNVEIENSDKFSYDDDLYGDSQNKW